MKAQPDISIITPTFNEEGNIRTLIEKVGNALSASSYEIIVEDDGDDKTADIAKSLAKQYNVRVFHRSGQKFGLAKAIVHGISEAKGKYICIIDADLQHPPEKIPEMLEKAQKTDADMVVASRYIPGGGAEGLSGPIRKLASLVTKYLAYLFVDPSRKTTDPTGGFFLFRRSAVDSVELKPIGFKISLEIMARGKIKKIEDVPYVFKTRTAEESKFNNKQIFLYLKHILYLFFTVPKLGRFLKFAMVGASGVVVNLGITTIAHELFGLIPQTSVRIGIGISIFTNFLLNNYFTWRDLRAKSVKDWTAKVSVYYLVSIISAIINDRVFYLASTKFGAHYLVAALIGIMVAMIFNFIFSKVIVWRETKQN